MAMEVKYHPHSFLLIKFADIFLNAPHFGKTAVLIIHIPFPIQIETHKITPVIPKDHTVGIDHRDDFKDEVLSQPFCFLWGEVAHDTLADVGALCLAGVLSGHYDYYFAGVGFLIRCVSDC